MQDRLAGPAKGTLGVMGAGRWWMAEAYLVTAPAEPRATAEQAARTQAQAAAQLGRAAVREGTLAMEMPEPPTSIGT